AGKRHRYELTLELQQAEQLERGVGAQGAAEVGPCCIMQLLAHDEVSDQHQVVAPRDSVEAADAEVLPHLEVTVAGDLYLNLGRDPFDWSGLHNSDLETKALPGL